jgi:tRNA threonylcarbamoyladenosine biosynthesis protein TsaE
VLYHAKTADETVALGRTLASRLKAGDVVAFYGDLGAGKTTMIKGVAAGLGVVDVVKSPSFVIVTEYACRLPVYHIDLYRLGARGDRREANGEQRAAGDEFEGIGLDSYLDGDGVCLIEWAERAEKVLPAAAIRVRMSVEGAGRRIEVDGIDVNGGLTSPSV